MTSSIVLKEHRLTCYINATWKMNQEIPQFTVNNSVHYHYHYYHYVTVDVCHVAHHSVPLDFLSLCVVKNLVYTENHVNKQTKA